MARIDQLLARYKRHLELPLRANLPLSQRVWFLVYPPDEERRLTNRIPEFEMATIDAGLQWILISLNGAFADWMDTFDEDEKQDCLRDADIVESYANPGFCDFICNRIHTAMQNVRDENRSTTVFVLSGLMELFDFIHVSTILEKIDNDFPGILILFFPGEREGNTYRFLSARTGWDYLAIPILSEG